MFETIQLIVSGLGVPLAAVLTYVIAKRMMSQDKILEITDGFLTELQTNTDLQKKVYVMGVLLGGGIRQGIGINKAGGGKFKMENLIGIGLQYFLGGKLGIGNNQQQNGEATPNEIQLPGI